MLCIQINNFGPKTLCRVIQMMIRMLTSRKFPTLKKKSKLKSILKPEKKYVHYLGVTDQFCWGATDTSCFNV